MLEFMLRIFAALAAAYAGVEKLEMFWKVLATYIEG